jgi:biotin operon repressor
MQKQQDVPVEELFDYDEETTYCDMLREELKKNWTGGFCRMPDAVRQDRMLSPKAKIVYEQLLAHMWFSTDRCYPSQQTLADETSYSRRTVIRACKELYERGYIEKWRRGQGYSNYYFINPLTFPSSFRRTKREQPETMILDVHAQIRREHETSSPPRSIDEALALCQTVTLARDTVSHPEVTNCHRNQTKGKQIQGSEMDSKDSSPPQKGRGVPVVTQATRNEREEGGEACRRERDTHTKTLEQAERDNHEPGMSEAKLHHSSSKPKNSSPSYGTQERAAGRRAKDAKDDKSVQKQTKQAAIAQATGIPQSVLSELEIAQTPAKRPIPAFIRNMMSHFSRELGDNPWCTKSNITQAAKLYFFVHESLIQGGIDPDDVFLQLLYKAKEDACHVTNVRYRNHEGCINRMPVFFTCLKNEMQLSEDEVLFVRSDELLYEPSW